MNPVNELDYGRDEAPKSWRGLLFVILYAVSVFIWDFGIYPPFHPRYPDTGVFFFLILGALVTLLITRFTLWRQVRHGSPVMFLLLVAIMGGASVIVGLALAHSLTIFASRVDGEAVRGSAMVRNLEV